MLNTIILIISSILILLGTIAIIIPYIPSVPIVFLGVLIYAIYTGFATISVTMIIIMFVLTLISIAISYFLMIYGSKYSGATKYGMYGAVIGILVGLIFSPFGFVSILICPPLGTIIGEIIAGKKLLESSKSSLGTIAGLFLGTLINISIVAWMIFVFVKAVL